MWYPFSKSISDKWHIDYDSSCDQDYKSSKIRFSIPLQGSGTEFANLTSEQRLLIVKYFCEEFRCEYRFASNIQQILKPDQISEVKLGQVARFGGGSIYTGVVHKAPSDSGDRLTLIVSGKLKKKINIYPTIT